MQRLQTFQQTKTKEHGFRRGTVQMELALFLPLYAAMLLILATIFSFAQTRSTVSIETRHAAWMKRHQIADETKELSEISGEAQEAGRILNGEVSPTLGLVSSTMSKNATIYLKTFHAATKIQMEHVLFTDPWDHRVIKFEDREEHPRLMLDQRVLAFGQPDLGAFGKLASLSADFGGEASDLNGSLRAQRRAANKEIRAAVIKVQRNVTMTENRIKDLKQELENARNAIPANPDQIDLLNDELRESNEKLNELRGQLKELNKTGEFLSSAQPE
ncbi:MAG: hypothetical protein JNL58_17145 [Planctomyces sp.]|nr:hypothetical protein [Planctomyces sp.]